MAKKINVRSLFIVMISLLVSLGCQLTSPTPASWVGTPTAQARIATNAAIRLTQESLVDEEIILIPTPEPEPTRIAPTITPIINADGPWLVYPAPDGDGIHAYDVDSHDVLEILLPEPIYTSDLPLGLSPDGLQLAIRAGSPENFDELALYLIDLPSVEPVKISPLLSLELQRKIVNQEGARALETLKAVTRKDGLAWSPDGRFLAFNAALDNDSSDLYIWDTLNQRIERLNGLYTQNASPFWSPTSSWLITQELGNYNQEVGWRPENVTGLQVPGYDDQNSLYIPYPKSIGEVFVGWLTPQDFVSYSDTTEGFSSLQQTNVDTLEKILIFDGNFDGVAFDPETLSIAMIIDEKQATAKNMEAGVYLLRPETAYFVLIRAGDWRNLSSEFGGQFVVSGFQGAYAFNSNGEGILLAGEKNILLSPGENWMLAWGDGGLSQKGLRLYQPDSELALQTVIESLIQNVVWAPDSQSFFALSDGVFYRLAFPGLSPQEIEDGFPLQVPIDFIWVE